jgi:hypothetical protein
MPSSQEVTKLVRKKHVGTAAVTFFSVAIRQTPLRTGFWCLICKRHIDFPSKIILIQYSFQLSNDSDGNDIIT